MNEQTKEQLAANAQIAWKLWSNWVMGVAGFVFTIYLALPTDQQQTLLAHLPVPPWVLPIAATVLGVLARVWPQKSLREQAPCAPAEPPQGGTTP